MTLRRRLATEGYLWSATAAGDHWNGAFTRRIGPAIQRPKDGRVSAREAVWKTKKSAPIRVVAAMQGRTVSIAVRIVKVKPRRPISSAVVDIMTVSTDSPSNCLVNSSPPYFRAGRPNRLSRRREQTR